MEKKTAAAKLSSAVRYICLAIWLGAMIAGVGSYLLYPHWFTADNIAEFLRRFEGEIWLIYLAMSALRGFSLLPSTPLVIAGTLLFPDQPLAVLAVSIGGILLSSTMIYYFSEFLGFHEYFEDHNPELTHKLKAKLEHPLGFLFVASWAFFPFVPTDLVCYLAGTTKMNYWKFITAIFAGELILCSCYVFFGSSLLKFVR
ncbi:MAG: TVP38/TMEM64 family protein [Pyrinomonadaceae bacterium]|nr:TVP38/TMEM64 family protein [Acidobacteriota bacterium]MBK7934652.1 TVP38/TMEM64 family protein [Acidobacteriota bacterium]MBP7375876.1 TVP38/TMEM64 family protein [Pyrinomonadaceae bacterium]